MSINIKSIFEQIATYLFTSTATVDDDKQFVINFVESKRINDKDKQIIKRNLYPIKSKVKLQQYICNSLLKYEGLSVYKPGADVSGIAPSTEDNF